MRRRAEKRADVVSGKKTPSPHVARPLRDLEQSGCSPACAVPTPVRGALMRRNDLHGSRWQPAGFCPGTPSRPVSGVLVTRDRHGFLSGWRVPTHAPRAAFSSHAQVISPLSWSGSRRRAVAPSRRRAVAPSSPRCAVVAPSWRRRRAVVAPLRRRRAVVVPLRRRRAVVAPLRRRGAIAPSWRHCAVVAPLRRRGAVAPSRRRRPAAPSSPRCDVVAPFSSRCAVAAPSWRHCAVVAPLRRRGAVAATWRRCAVVAPLRCCRTAAPSSHRCDIVAPQRRPRTAATSSHRHVTGFAGGVAHRDLRCCLCGLPCCTPRRAPARRVRARSVCAVC